MKSRKREVEEESENKVKREHAKRIKDSGGPSKVILQKPLAGPIAQIGRYYGVYILCANFIFIRTNFIKINLIKFKNMAGK
jgi:hypothetical protein